MVVLKARHYLHSFRYSKRFSKVDNQDKETQKKVMMTLALIKIQKRFKYLVQKLMSFNLCDEKQKKIKEDVYPYSSGNL